MMWNFDAIISMVIIFALFIGVVILAKVVAVTAELVTWAWEQLRILRRRDGQDV